MRVLLKMTLDCSPDAAWRALRSPSVMTEVAFPLLAFESLEEGGFPEVWPGGPHRVEVRLAGLVPVGEQEIDTAFEQHGDVRIVRDTGRAVVGPMTLVTRFRHSMAVSAAPGGRTLYRDQLEIDAGLATPLVWLAYWAFWQWRGFGIRRMAPSWR